MARHTPSMIASLGFECITSLMVANAASCHFIHASRVSVIYDTN